MKQLLEWVCWAGQEGEKEQLREILGHTPPDSHHSYWRMLYRLVLTGRLAEARNLLAHHSAFTLREEVSHRNFLFVEIFLKIHHLLLKILSLKFFCLKKISVPMCVSVTVQ